MLNQADIDRIILSALDEDIGNGDITSQLLIPSDLHAEIYLVAREPMVMCGGFIPGNVYAHLTKTAQVQIHAEEGQRVDENTLLITINGPAQALLTGERVALNLMQRMCGIASMTCAFVKAVSGTKAIILDTRKTMPGLRALDKYAVRTGGGTNHRMGLYDAVMIKDNHIAIAMQQGGLGIKALVEKVRCEGQPAIPVIVECDTLVQVSEAIEAKPDRILLDNMNPETMRQAVQLAAGRITLEASGGMTLERVREVAETGVNYISVGQLTHSVKAADIGADISFKLS